MKWKWTTSKEIDYSPLSSLQSSRSQLIRVLYFTKSNNKKLISIFGIFHKIDRYYYKLEMYFSKLLATYECHGA